MAFTCGGCDNTWTGTAKCHCYSEGCHRTFTGLAGFDAHRVSGRCQDPSKLRVKDEDSPRFGERVLFCVDGVWGSEENPVSGADRAARLAKARAARGKK